MKEKRTIQTVQKSIAAFFRENRRMPSFAEMVGLLGVRSKSVVNFWIDKLIEAEILEKDDKGHLKFKKSLFAIPLVGSVRASFPSPGEEALCDIMFIKKSLLKRFQHFIESTDWEERYLCNHWIDKMCIGGIVVSMIYFTPLLMSIIQE